LHATGDHVHARLAGVLRVPSAPPTARLASASVVADRHALVRPDLSPSSDADGRIVAAEADWGDGATDRGTPGALGHAYDLPGAYEATFRVQDDADVWSGPATLLVEVRDRAPLLSIPARLVADRVSNLTIPVAVSDPDGDAVALRWVTGDISGEGRPVVRFATLGSRAVRVEAEDPYGLRAHAETLVDTVDLPPEILSAEARVAPDGATDLVGVAADADGPTPALAWRVDGALAAATHLRLDPGAHVAELIATDVDGARSVRSFAFVVGASSPTPRIDRVTSRLVGDALVVDYLVTPEDASVRFSWTSDAGDGSVVATASPVTVPLRGASQARGSLVATLGELTATGETVALRRGASDVAPPLVLEASAGSGRVGDVIRLRSTASGAVAYRFDFGDGNATPWSSEVHAAHAYDRAGLYGIVAQARAASGAVASASGTVLVEETPALAKTAAPAPVADIVEPLTSTVPPSPEAPPPREAQVPASSLAPALALGLALAMRRRPRAPA
jgi:hypothetical protein